MHFLDSISCLQSWGLDLPDGQGALDANSFSLCGSSAILAPSPQCSSLLCTVSWDCLHQWIFFTNIWQQSLGYSNPLSPPRPQAFVLDGQVIFPLSPRRKFMLVSCASLQAGEGCLFHIINGQRKRVQFILLIGMNVCSFKRKMCVFASPKQTHNFP